MSHKLSAFRPKAIAALTVAVFMATLGGLVAASAQSSSSQSTAKASSNDLARCTQLYGLWSKYRGNGSDYSNQDMRAEVALQQCKDGRADSGIAELEAQLRSKGVSVPRPQSASSP